MLPHLNESVSLLSDARPAFPTERAAAAAGRKAVDDAEQFRCLVARPAARTDLASIMQIASHVNLASMRSEKAKNQVGIEQSIRTLAGDLAWQQGLLFLAADLFPLGGGPRELAGNVKLQVGW